MVFCSNFAAKFETFNNSKKHYYDKENFYYRIGTRSSTFDERVHARK